VTPPLARRVRALSIHAGYCCHHTGVCCSSGWDIPVETEMHLRNALASGRLRIPEAAVTSMPARGGDVACFRVVSGLPRGARVVFSSDSSGRCIFLDAHRHCAIHRQLGPEALPSACRDFPRIVTLTPLGVSITLSHCCPTAASMLFAPVTPSDPRRPGREGPTIRILENPAGFPPSWPYEGLDARDALPPPLRPGVLMDWPSLERWEKLAVAVIGDEERTPEAALRVLAAAAEDSRRWTPAEGEFRDYFSTVLERSLGGGEEENVPAFVEALRDGFRDSRNSASGELREWHLVAGCVPHRSLLPSPPEGLDDADRRLVAPGWPSVARPIRRWLAAKAFASWLALQGEGLRTTALGLRVALGVLRAEAARGCAEAGRTLDAELLKEAVRRADLLLVHLADPDAVARRLGRCELPRAPTSGRPPAAPIAWPRCGPRGPGHR
jgi:Fe-S-cluster containining protein